MIASLQCHHDSSAFQKTKTHTFSLFSFTHLVSGYLVETGHKICIKDVTWLQINSAHGSVPGHETNGSSRLIHRRKWHETGLRRVREPRQRSQNLFFVGFLRGGWWFPSSSLRLDPIFGQESDQGFSRYPPPLREPCNFILLMCVCVFFKQHLLMIQKKCSRVVFLKMKIKPPKTNISNISPENWRLV